MTLPATATPQSVMREVTEDIIRRRSGGAGRSAGRSTSAVGQRQNQPVESLNPDTAEGRQKLEAYLTPIGRHYTISGLGAPEEITPSVGARSICPWAGGSWWGRWWLSFAMKGTPLKNRLYRLMVCT